MLFAMCAWGWSTVSAFGGCDAFNDSLERYIGVRLWATIVVLFIIFGRHQQNVPFDALIELAHVDSNFDLGAAFRLLDVS